MTGKQVKALRERLGLSQPAFAHLVQAAPTSVSRWERGASPVSAKSAHLIEIHALGKKVDAPEPRELPSPR